jgi:hypothetical protein
MFFYREFFGWHSVKSLFVECLKENTQKIIWHCAKSQILILRIRSHSYYQSYMVIHDLAPIGSAMTQSYMVIHDLAPIGSAMTQSYMVIHDLAPTGSAMTLPTELIVCSDWGTIGNIISLQEEAISFLYSFFWFIESNELLYHYSISRKLITNNSMRKSLFR